MNQETLSKFDRKYKRRYPAFWIAMKHHRNHKGGRLSFRDHAYQYTMLMDQAPHKIAKKSTQCGVSEVLNVWANSRAIMKKRSVFGVYPNGKLVRRAVQNRFNKSLQKTPYYRAVQTLSKKENKDRSESIQLKDVGGGVISLNSSESADSFAEFPADDGFIDELDYCNQENIQMFPERFSHATDPTWWKIGNPTQIGFGIDKEYLESDQRHWYIKHDCGNWITPDWFKHVVHQVDDIDYVIRDSDWTWDSSRDIQMICEKCGKPFNGRSAGIWIPTYPDREKHGYEISKLISGTTSIKEIMDRFIQGLKNETIMQRVYNGDLGLARTAADSKITNDILRECLGDHGHRAKISGPGIMGIDVGKVLNVVIAKPKWMAGGDVQIIVTHILEVPSDVNEIARLIQDNDVRAIVMDGLPELNLTRTMKNKFKNLFACFYHEQARDIPKSDRIMTVNRTASLDDVLGALRLKNIVLPANAESIPDFFKQMTAGNRILDLKANYGGGVYRWVETGPDHYHHAFNYMLLALKILVLHMRKR